MSVETNSHNYTNMNLIFSQFVARQNFAKKESRSPRGFLPRPLLRAGESAAPPPLPQKNSGGAHHFRFRFLDLCIRFGKIISKVCEGFNSGAKKLDTNSDFEDESVRSPSPANGGAGLRLSAGPPPPLRGKEGGFLRGEKKKWIGTRILKTRVSARPVPPMAGLGFALRRLRRRFGGK